MSASGFTAVLGQIVKLAADKSAFQDQVKGLTRLVDKLQTTEEPKLSRLTKSAKRRFDELDKVLTARGAKTPEWLQQTMRWPHSSPFYGLALALTPKGPFSECYESLYAKFDSLRKQLKKQLFAELGRSQLVGDISKAIEKRVTSLPTTGPKAYKLGYKLSHTNFNAGLLCLLSFGFRSPFRSRARVGLGGSCWPSHGCQTPRTDCLECNGDSSWILEGHYRHDSELVVKSHFWAPTWTRLSLLRGLSSGTRAKSTVDSLGSRSYRSHTLSGRSCRVFRLSPGPAGSGVEGQQTGQGPARHCNRGLHGLDHHQAEPRQGQQSSNFCSPAPKPTCSLLECIPRRLRSVS